MRSIQMSLSCIGPPHRLPIFTGCGAMVSELLGSESLHRSAWHLESLLIRTSYDGFLQHITARHQSLVVRGYRSCRGTARKRPSVTVQKLIEIGKEKGYLLYDKVSDLLPICSHTS